MYVLFISYKFVKGFLAITFLLLAFSNRNFHDVCQRLLYDQKRNFTWIQQKTQNFPLDPILKIAHFCNVMSKHDLTKMGNFYNGGLWKKCPIVCRIKLKFRFWLIYEKCWHTSWKFQLKKRSYKKVIAKKPLTNLYKMNSSMYLDNIVYFLFYFILYRVN